MPLDGVPDGYAELVRAIVEGITPDAELWLDEWSEENVKLPKEIAAEHGDYDPDRTVGAREILRWLSPAHPCQRVVVVGPSQFLKTQVALNAICGWIDKAPGNILALEPTGGLAKRLSNRITKMFGKVQSLAGKIAAERSRDARNTLDTKEFDGGTLYIATAGSASNLAEVMARYLFGDEIDRWEGDVEGEGDPVKLAENRTTTYRYNRKMYYASSPVRAGRSRIIELHDQGTQCVVEVPCPHCFEYHELTGEHFHYNEDATQAWFVCPSCTCVIEERSKEWMLGRYRVRARAEGDGETESIHLSAYLMPPGRITWVDLAKEHRAAELAIAGGGENPHKLMKVYRNTREALPYSTGVVAVGSLELQDRAEDYPPQIAPWGGLVLTVGVDVQRGDKSRLAIIVRAWGREDESWLVYWGEIAGETCIPLHGAWLDLEAFLFGAPQFRHASGAAMEAKAVSIDSGDGVTQEAVYAFVRKWQHRGVMATKGASDRGQRKAEIYSPPKTSIDPGRRNKPSKYGVRPYLVGTHAAKNLILKVRLPIAAGARQRMHAYKLVRSDYWDQVTSEVEEPSERRGEMVWTVLPGRRNEALDCEVLALHAARSLRLHTLQEHVWASIEMDFRQASMFEAPTPQAPPQLDAELTAPAPQPLPQAPQAPAPVEPAPREPHGDWIGDHSGWLD